MATFSHVCSLSLLMLISTVLMQFWYYLTVSSGQDLGCCLSTRRWSFSSFTALQVLESEIIFIYAIDFSQKQSSCLRLTKSISREHT